MLVGITFGEFKINTSHKIILLLLVVGFGVVGVRALVLCLKEGFT